MGLWTTILIGYFTWGLMGRSERSMADIDVEGDSNCEVPAQEVLEGKSISMYPTDYSSEISQRIMAAFCPCGKICLRLN